MDKDNVLSCCMYGESKATDIYLNKMLDVIEKASMESK